jgi:hypothetical protein
MWYILHGCFLHPIVTSLKKPFLTAKAAKNAKKIQKRFKNLNLRKEFSQKSVRGFALSWRSLRALRFDCFFAVNSIVERWNKISAHLFCNRHASEKN